MSKRRKEKFNEVEKTQKRKLQEIKNHGRIQKGMSVTI
jgi:hypothetical protein